MPLENPSQGYAPVRVTASGVTDLAWLVFALETGKPFGQDLAIDDPSAAEPELAKEAREFWNDGTFPPTELFLIAHWTGMLAEHDPTRLIKDLVRRHPPGEDLGLLTESETDRAAVRARLTRLAENSKLRRSYSQLLLEVWQAFAAIREEEDERTRLTCARLQNRLDEGESLWRLLPEGHMAFNAKLRPLVDDASRHGDVVITPGPFVRSSGHVIHLPRLFHIGVAADPRESTKRRHKDEEQIARWAKLLSERTRVRILLELGREPRSVTELAKLLGISQPAVTEHIRLLREAGLLHSSKHGKRIRYEVSRQQLERLLDGIRLKMLGLSDQGH
jgi:DNA-binding transcriptional ArsR family regulator